MHFSSQRWSLTENKIVRTLNWKSRKAFASIVNNMHKCQQYGQNIFLLCQKKELVFFVHFSHYGCILSTVMGWRRPFWKDAAAILFLQLVAHPVHFLDVGEKNFGVNSLITGHTWKNILFIFCIFMGVLFL